jgi:hypothetical protein
LTQRFRQLFTGIPSARTREASATLAFAAILLCLWSLTHEYRGLVYDAQIYAVEALARLRPSLAADLFLQNLSQAQFTVFPLFYAWVIQLVGLGPAALLLTIVFTLWFLGATWGLVATITNQYLAWLAIFMVVALEGHYGAFGVFYITQPFLTARLPAQALVATALVCHFKGYPQLSFILTIVALFVHPLMALPGLLLLTWLHLPRAFAVGACIGLLGALATAIAASHLPAMSPFFAMMDSTWINVVEERSQFLFLQLWRPKDWALNAMPFLTLAFAVLIFRPGAARTLALGALLVGLLGMLFAAIASLVGPVALFVQGQAWRSAWITTFASILLLLPTACEAWRNDKIGPVCATLLISGWLLPVQAGAACESLALLAWIGRSRIPTSWTKYAPLAAGVLALAVVLLSLTDSRAILSNISAPPGEYFIVACVRALFSSKTWCVLSVAVLFWGIRSSRGALFPAATFCALVAAAIFLLLQSSRHVTSYGSDSDIREFADWRDRIPAASTVFVTNGRDSGSFVWFTLQRNNYLSTGQSAGVVFSRTTALEVDRRSKVLLPLADPDWKILTSLQQRKAGSPHSAAQQGAAVESGISGSPGLGAQRFRRLTEQALVSVCHDSLLGFVVSPDDVGFDAVPHIQPGIWKNWRLYDCSLVRAREPAA